MRSTHLLEEDEVLHVASADLDHIHRVEHLLDVARIHQFGDDRKPRLGPCLLENGKAFTAKALEGVRRELGLERTAAQHRPSGIGHGTRGLERLLPMLDCARASDEAGTGIAACASVDVDHRRIG